MSVSFYCVARRPSPLAAEEKLAIDRILAKYSVETRIKRYEETGQGIPWRALHLLPPEKFSYADAILEGTAEIPTDSDEALSTAIVHWCNAASALRREIHKALWEVRVEDREIEWDYLHERYDPWK
jgi:hypothetical protein